MGALIRRPQSDKEDSSGSSPIRLQTENKGNFSRIISTGSTLLDLAISGGRVRGGGIPGGIIVEIFGPSGCGKTSILSEIIADAQKKGAEATILDPEARLDQEYARIYGVEMDKSNYAMPQMVNEVFEYIFDWDPKEPPPGVMNVVGVDSLAALSSDLEMSKTGDKRGQKIAKDFNMGLRKTCVKIRENNWLIACTNQIRQGDVGETTPGGMGIPFFSSLRIRVGPPVQDKYIKRKVKYKGKDYEKITGIRSICTVKKSSVDDPYRAADVYIGFGYGVDDIRANLQYNKTVSGEATYDAVTKTFASMQSAITHIEKEGLVKELRNRTIDIWEELNEAFKLQRKPKTRGGSDN